MPSKSKRGKGKRSFQSKKKKGRRSSPATVAQRQATTQTREPVALPRVATPPASVPTQISKLSAVQYPYILTELRRIGILAGIILAILVVLALVLS